MILNILIYLNLFDDILVFEIFDLGVWFRLFYSVYSVKVYRNMNYLMLNIGFIGKKLCNNFFF